MLTVQRLPYRHLCYDATQGHHFRIVGVAFDHHVGLPSRWQRYDKSCKLRMVLVEIQLLLHV